MDAYYIWLNDQQTGPFTIEQLRNMWRIGKINSKLLYWREGGCDEWLPLSTLSDELQPPQQSYMVSSESASRRNSHAEKKILPAFLLCLFVGCLGAHRFYAGKVGTGILLLFTWILFIFTTVIGTTSDIAGIHVLWVVSGLGFGIWILIDFIMIIIGSFTDGDGAKICQWT